MSGRSRLVLIQAYPRRKIVDPQVYPDPNTLAQIMSPFLTFPSLYQWSRVSGIVAAVVLP